MGEDFEEELKTAAIAVEYAMLAIDDLAKRMPETDAVGEAKRLTTQSIGFVARAVELLNQARAKLTEAGTCTVVPR